MLDALLSLRFSTRPAFTITELLISLTLISVLAVSVIPQFIKAGSAESLATIQRESLYTVSQAYASLSSDGTVEATMDDLSKKVDRQAIGVDASVTSYDRPTRISSQSSGFWSCGATSCPISSSIKAVRLRNNALLIYRPTPFSGASSNAIDETRNNAAMVFVIDADGKFNNNPASATEYWLYMDGTIRPTGERLLDTNALGNAANT